MMMDAETVKKVLLSSVQGGDIGSNGNLIAKISLMRLFQQFAKDMEITKISLDGDYINIYISAQVNWQPIDVGNGINVDISKYVTSTMVKLTLKKKFIDDLMSIANLPIVGVEQVGVGNTTDVVIKVDTGRKLESTIPDF